MKTTTTMTVSLRPELLEQIREIADRQNRHLSNMVTVLLNEGLCSIAEKAGVDNAGC